MDQSTRECSIKIEIERLKEKLNKELEQTRLPNDRILLISQELDILIAHYIKSK